MSDMSEAEKRAEALRKELNQYNYEYHVLDQPTVPDAVYDQKLHELVQLEENIQSSLRMTHRPNALADNR